MLFYRENSESARVIYDNNGFYCKHKYRSSYQRRCFPDNELWLYIYDLQEMMQIFAASCCRSLWTRCVLCQRPLSLMREQFHLCGWKLLREPLSS